MTFLSISFSDIFFHDLVCLFLELVPARAGTHAWHVFAFVVSRFSAGNYFEK